MRTNVNLVVQVLVVSGCFGMRLLTPGWLMVIFFFVVPIGSAALIAQIVAAAVAARRRDRLSTRLSVGFGLLAATLLGASALLTDGGDGGRSRSPLGLVLGQERPEVAWAIAWLVMLTWFGTHRQPGPGQAGGWLFRTSIEAWSMVTASSKRLTAAA